MQVAVLPAKSVAVHMTMVTPRLKTESDALVHDTLTCWLELSVVVGAEYDTCCSWLTMLSGQVIVGSSRSNERGDINSSAFSLHYVP